MNDDDANETIENRKIAVRAMRDAAARGNGLAGAALEIEAIAEPYFLGFDEDEDGTDLDVFP